ncbi:MAG: hypothetical protein AAF492_11500 [Verrucomicrobiota bacterium]
MKKSILLAGLLGGMAMAFGCDGDSNSDVRDLMEEGVPTFRIEPSARFMGAGNDFTTFQVVGGNPPFTWSMEDTSLGLLNGTADGAPVETDVRTVNYSRASSTTDGANTIVVVDAGGNRASATVISDTGRSLVPVNNPVKEL